MTRNEYTRAAQIVQIMRGFDSTSKKRAQGAEDAFVEFFSVDAVKFNEKRFREACQPTNDR